MGFERLRVYQAVEQLDAETQQLIRNVTRGNADDLNQPGRSCGSILFNIPEAYGAGTPGKKRNHLAIARGEADEVRAVLRRLVKKGCLKESEIRRACELTSVIAKMLTAWIDKLPE
jgi:four helix bundle protein